MKVYGIKNCNTVKKALQWLDGHGISYEFHDFKKLGVSLDKLKQWEGTYSWEDLLNKRGTTWRQLPQETKDAVTDATSANKLLLEKTSAIKRPVIEQGNTLLLGFDASEYEQKLK
ncbi:ArsC family reductase [Olivibacter sitiensis]|uniref:ArsC family reductase n=1 Tax=Olivibacter sitiensis TaxID=376470 RepID=UPI0004230DA5|nr:ArsC family reductase [Olivibacter sitiensis]